MPRKQWQHVSHRLKRLLKTQHCRIGTDQSIHDTRGFPWIAVLSLGVLPARLGLFARPRLLPALPPWHDTHATKISTHTAPGSLAGAALVAELLRG
jgi:hypothetical protein